jgi:ascorbate-specific PTS system EIIC-type component UlaA
MVLKGLLYTIIGTFIGMGIIWIFSGKFNWFVLIPTIISFIVFEMIRRFFNWNWKI